MLSVGKGNGPDWLLFQNDIRRTSNVCQKIPTSTTTNEHSQTSISISPNPLSHFTTITLSLPLAASVAYSISTMQGAVIEKMPQQQFSSGIHRLHWNVPTSLASGLYLCTVHINEEKSSFKIMVQ